MNFDQPLSPAEELEIRITAMLMGELSPEETAVLKEQLADNPELQALHTRLANAFDLLRSAVPLGDKIEQITPARLSNERRERLLRRFRATAGAGCGQTIVPIQTKRWTWLAPLSWAASFTIAIGILVAMMAIPASNTLSARKTDSSDFYAESGAFVAPPQVAAPIPSDRVAPPASATTAPAEPLARRLAGNTVDESRLGQDSSNQSYGRMLYYRGRGIEEPGKAFSGGSTSGQPPRLAGEPQSATPQITWQPQPGAIPRDSSSRSGAVSAAPPAEAPSLTDNRSSRAVAVVEGESRKLDVNTATDKSFWDTPAAPALPASGPAAATNGAIARNAPASVRERALVEEGQMLASELAEAKAMNESIKRESDDLKSTLGDVEKSMAQLKKAIPGVSAEQLAAKLKELEKSGLPTEAAGTRMSAGQAGEEVKLLNEGRASGGKAVAPAPPAKPATATGAIAGTSVDSLATLQNKLAEGVPQLETTDGGVRAYAGTAIVGGIPMERAQSESKVEKLADLTPGDELSRKDNAALGTKLMPVNPTAASTLGRADVPGDLNAPAQIPGALFGAEAKPTEPALNMDSDFADLDRTTAAVRPAAENGAKRFLLDANGFADTSRYDLAKERFSEILSIDPSNIEAREGMEKIDQRRNHFGGTAYDEARSKKTWKEQADEVAPAREFDVKSESENIATSTDDQWYFKTDGTLSKLTKGTEVATPSQQPATLSLKPVAEDQVTLSKEVDAPVAAPKAVAPVPQPEITTSTNAFSTFSLNVTDVAFKLAAATLEQNKMPDPAAIRSEEFINAFDYRDPEPIGDAPLAFASERARYPFAHNRDLLRLSIKTAAVGRQPGRPLNLVLLVDNSGSMERADRVQILRESLRILAAQLQPTDKLSIITFARTPHLWVDGVAGNEAPQAMQRVGEITPLGGTNLSAALDLAYETARKHYQAANVNRVVLLTDGAANLGNVNPAALKQKVEAQRKLGIALDCFGVGWEGYNDDLLEQLSRNGDGRYGFINSPDAAATEFAGQLAGALRVAASDVKVQVEFNPKRVTAYRQIGYAKHQLTKEQFRDNTVDAAEIGAAESGNALYIVEVNPRGEGDLAKVRARFKVPGTNDYREHEWAVPFSPNIPALEQASPAIRLAAAAGAFSEQLAGSPYAAEITSDKLLGLINGVPQAFSPDPRPQKLEWMIRQAKSLSGR